MPTGHWLHLIDDLFGQLRYIRGPLLHDKTPRLHSRGIKEVFHQFLQLLAFCKEYGGLNAGSAMKGCCLITEDSNLHPYQNIELACGVAKLI